jgi:hypothetical protein
MQLSLMTADRIQLGRSGFAVACSLLTEFMEGARKVGLCLSFLVFRKHLSRRLTHEHVSGSGEPSGTGRRA